MKLKVRVRSWAAVVLALLTYGFIASAIAQDAERETDSSPGLVDNVQNLLSNVSELERKLAAVSQRVELLESMPSQPSCTVVSSSVNTTGGQTGDVSVSVPEGRWMAGGGCLNSTLLRKFIASYPTNDRTWHCRDRDHGGVAAAGTLTAHALSCEIRPSVGVER